MLGFNGSQNFSEPLNYLLQESAQIGKRRKERYPHHRFFGIFCSYFPEEIILASGLEPLRLFPDSPNSTPVELPAYCCSLARGTLEMAVQDQWQDLVGVGFAHTCDTMQCLSGIWASLGKTPTVDIVPPVMLKTAGATRYYRAEVEAAWAELQRLSAQQLSPESLRNAVELCQTYRRLAAEVDALRPDLPSPLVASILRAGQLMPRTQYIDALEAVLPELKQLAHDSRQDTLSRTRLLISGAILENDSLYTLVENLDGRVVADDSCTGTRHFAEYHSSDLSDPWAYLINRYIEMPPCPCKHKGLNERFDHLYSLAEQRQAEGIILVIRKYCEPHAWDAVHLKERFEQRGLRTLVLELEGADAGGAERTRVQAFLESIQAQRTPQGGVSNG